jgi:hypothetical protein
LIAKPVLEQFAQAGVDVDAFGCPPAGRGREIFCEIMKRINGRDRVQERRALNAFSFLFAMQLPV